MIVRKRETAKMMSMLKRTVMREENMIVMTKKKKMVVGKMMGIVRKTLKNKPTVKYVTIPPTPQYPNSSKSCKKVAPSSRTVVDTTCKSSSEKLGEESDSDSFDPFGEEKISTYSKLGDITPTIRRMVLRGQERKKLRGW